MYHSKILEKIKFKINSIKVDSLTLWFAFQKKETPLHFKLVGFLILAYAFSPIDLIPDFIPIIGFLDELILLPILLFFAIKLIPQKIYLEAKLLAENWIIENRKKPKSKLGLFLILLIWIALTYFVIKFLFKS
jgi:uncharacterized membrane protein YkvA (DUF1232 family)